MRIVIDLQGAQAKSKGRGIGRYSLSLSKAMVANRGEHEIILALNGLFPKTVDEIRQVFSGLLSREQIRVWQAPGPLNHLSEDNHWQRHSAELLREAFLASLKPDLVLITSLFEGFSDDAVTSIGMLGSRVPTAAVLYDLIPFINRKLYLENPLIAKWYDGKISHFRRADLLLAISASSRQEGISHLGFSPESIVNISTAADAHFEAKNLNQQQRQNLMEGYGIHADYVMYTGGIDHRKNIDGLIRSYAALSADIRKQHQLVVVCSVRDMDRDHLNGLATRAGLADDELVLTGFVSEDDLVSLYSYCKLFVFPSWHEGFGLPALEAMSCGRAVIGSNVSSLPEVIGCEQALFDPFDEVSITAKLEQVLLDDDFRQMLEQHGLRQAKSFSWDSIAQRAITAIEQYLDQHGDAQKRAVTAATKPLRRPRLAYVSPMPPERSGISDYSAELLPQLACHYDIDVILAQELVSSHWNGANCAIRTVQWFRQNAARYDRVLYHFGNSEFHQHMFDLLQQIPGVVVLHDFFLSGIVAHMDATGYKPEIWSSELYHSHGYRALKHRAQASDSAEVIYQYPCNFSVLQRASGVIIHSEYSRDMAISWYGGGIADDWIRIPLLRVPDLSSNKQQARQALGFDDDDFVVCSFGLLGKTKQNHRLLDAWLASSLVSDPRCKLVFVGQNTPGEYGDALVAKINQLGLNQSITITGWADSDIFRQYLAAADVGVQLRTLSRGETSAAVLDCMNYGLATIVNANGSSANLPQDGVYKLADGFGDDELASALQNLWLDTEQRKQLGQRAQQIARTEHAPRRCAGAYFDAIEQFYQQQSTSTAALISSLASIEQAPMDGASWMALARSIELSVLPAVSQKQFFVDISELVQRDSKTGIQRVVRSILQQLLQNPPAGMRVEPVYAAAEHGLGYHYARRFTARLLGFAPQAEDELISYRAGDVFLGLDLSLVAVQAQQTFYQQMRGQGVLVKFVVYDLLCIEMPEYFVQGEGEGPAHGLALWLGVIGQTDGVICISKTTADQVSGWIAEYLPRQQDNFVLSWFHLGADVENSIPSKGMPDNATATLAQLRQRPGFLSVGTVEPRKGHAQVLAAFELLWQQGVDANYIIVGSQGWMVDELVAKLRNHPELNQRLFWFDDISDEYLTQIYAVSSCLIAASFGEGFGLPLIEAAQHKLPIIARDIPVFKEVAGQHAFYFCGQHPEDLATAIQQWFTLYETQKHPVSTQMPWLKWRESANNLLTILSRTDAELTVTVTRSCLSPNEEKEIETSRP
jgi:glycosyltransferase involved in cell wall biosynthesis